MKKILAIVALMFVFGGNAKAASSQFVGVMESTWSVHVVSVSSFTATAVPASGTVLRDRTAVTIINADASFGVSCGNSAANVAAGHAFTIPAGGSITLNIREYSAKFNAVLMFYCLTTKTTGATNVSVIQGY